MNSFLFLVIIYFSGVFVNVLAIKVYNKFGSNPFKPENVCLVWYSIFFWLLVLISGVIDGVNWLNDKFKNWLCE